MKEYWSNVLYCLNNNCLLSIMISGVPNKYTCFLMCEPVTITIGLTFSLWCPHSWYQGVIYKYRFIYLLLQLWNRQSGIWEFIFLVFFGTASFLLFDAVFTNLSWNLRTEAHLCNSLKIDMNFIIPYLMPVFS
jgi:hypothetical protein